MILLTLQLLSLDFQDQAVLKAEDSALPFS